jgi:hypothetical protein
MDADRVFTLVLALCFLTIPFVWWLSRYMQLQNAKNWPSSEGTIQSAEIEIVNSARCIPIRLPVCAFSYDVNGNHYSGRISLLPYITSTESIPGLIIGKKLPVQYDPRHPSTYYIPLDEMEGCEVKQRIGPHLFRLYPKN